MASTSRSPRQVSTPVPAGLPLGLQPYHLLFSGTVISIVLLGTLYSLLTGSHLYNTHIAPGAHLPFDDSAAQAGLQRPASLFADKRNIFNQLFVKQAWFWTTCVVVLQAWTMRSSAGSEPGGATGATGETPSEVAKGKRKAEEGDENEGEGDKGHAPVPARAPPATISSPMARSILRWFISTCCWVLFTFWFFGPPLMERVLTATGGQCMPAPTGSIELPGAVDGAFCRSKKHLTPITHPELFQTGHMVVASGGGLRAYWRGGHDISGHTFILALSTLYILEELSPFLPHLLPTSSTFLRSLFPRPMWSRISPLSSTHHSDQDRRRNMVVLGMIASLVLVWGWMLLMTAVYFHTPTEKITGLLVGLGAWLLLPKGG